ncbi:MAG TPA: DUF411 domain-containing protein [Acidobacteriota bacterium]|nr:DUF411 domain-containing protein [Acidobacteriota bacterium]
MNTKRIAVIAVVLVAFAGGWLYAGRTPLVDGTKVVMYQNPACGCCSKWAAHMEATGFTVEIHKTDQLNSIKQREGITPETAGCHTSMVDGYLVEGHVPAREIARLITDRPDVKGIAVPGMPMGSPGMEGGRTDHYDVLSIDHEGNTAVFASY